MRVCAPRVPVCLGLDVMLFRYLGPMDGIECVEDGLMATAFRRCGAETFLVKIPAIMQSFQPLRHPG